jgi:calpain-15
MCGGSSGGGVGGGVGGGKQKTASPGTGKLTQQHLKWGKEGTGELFVDSEFPAAASSIDGRPAAPSSSSSSSSSSSAAATTAKCKCGVPAKLSQVSKDGPNQGRWFETCVKREGAGRCGHFKWADHAPHDTKNAARKWKRHGPEAGYVLWGSSGPQPDDVRQGSVGDCWFLSAVASVAERPELIRALLDDSEWAQGKVTWRLFVDGDWARVSVDTFLPTLDEAEIAKMSKKEVQLKAGMKFARPNGSKVWVPLLEKAVAKVHGSYLAISGGWPEESFRFLTGAPVHKVLYVRRPR